MNASSCSRSRAVGAALVYPEPSRRAPPVAPSGANENNIRPHVTSSTARPSSRRALLPPVIPNEAGRFFLPASLPRSGRPANLRNLSYGLSGGFSAGGLDFADGVAGFGAAGLPTVKYLRIFSSRFGPSPRIASKSSTLLNGPYDFRICRIFSAVTGPIPGTCCSSSDFAVLRFTGVAGGFFFPPTTAVEKIKPRKRKEERSRIGNRRAIAGI
jgi:hypothetical protein